MSTPDIDINENNIISINKRVLMNLLIDKTTSQNIIWATNDYDGLGNLFGISMPITIDSITGAHNNVIQPRVVKNKNTQWNRQKKKAEVFTPAWICNQQNNLIDDAWFGKKNVFNSSEKYSWNTKKERITFSTKKGSRWKDYVDAKRIEFACGEAPYLTSRYDMLSGEYIHVPDRIGLLDRKLRVVYENTHSLEEWIVWATRAIQSIYGFEFQGDNLLIARENILFTFIENMQYYYHQNPNTKLLLKISNIIAWNIWQMDGTTYKVPYTDADNETMYCKIHDWRAKETVLFIKSIRKDAK